MLPCPSSEDIARILHTCITQKNHGWAVCMHKFLRIRGSLDHVLFGNRLVCMLVEIGSIQMAREVFDGLAHRDEWSWNVLIGWFCKARCFQQALSFYHEMQRDVSLHPSGHTFALLFRACMEMKDWVRGTHLHAEVARIGLLETNSFVGSTLVQMYLKCGFLSLAQDAFDNLPARDTVLWTSLMTGYLENGLGEHAIMCFERMKLDHTLPDALTIVCALKACSIVGDLEKGIEIHAEVERQGLFNSDNALNNTLVDMYGKLGKLCVAREILDGLQGRSTVSWNALITCYAEHGHGGEALLCFEQMQKDGIKPDSVTFIGVLKACCSIGAITKAAEIYAEIERDGLENDFVVSSTLVHLYAKSGQLSLARQMFDHLLVRDAIIWTSILAGYVEHGQGEEALDLFDLMQLEGISPNAVTFVASLRACGGTGAIDKGTEIHVEVERHRLLEKDLVLGNTLIDMYAKCGLLPKAQEVFDCLPVRDVISWNALIAGHAQGGKGKEVGTMLDRMHGEKIKPDPVTFIVVLSACLRAGLLYKCESYFENMSKEYGMIPSIKHHTCLVAHLSREGYLDKAASIIRKMPLSPNLALWHSLLFACKQLENFELGRQTFDIVVSQERKGALVY